MIKITVLLRRRPDLSWEQFDRYWREEHTPILNGMSEMTDIVRRYVQLHTANSDGTALPTPGFDGVAEIWVDDLASATRLFTSDNYTKVVGPDEDNFLDRSQTVVLLSEETVLK